MSWFRVGGRMAGRCAPVAGRSILFGLALVVGCNGGAAKRDGGMDAMDAVALSDHGDTSPGDRASVDVGGDAGDGRSDIPADLTGDAATIDAGQEATDAAPETRPDVADAEDASSDAVDEMDAGIDEGAGPPDATTDLTTDLVSDAGADLSPPPQVCGGPGEPVSCPPCKTDQDCSLRPHAKPGYGRCYFGFCNYYPVVCQDGFADCTQNADDGCPTDLASDPMNCGGCFIVCGVVPGSPGVCHDGTCVGECPEGAGDCTPEFGCETSLRTQSNCGACGRLGCDLANVDAPCTDGRPSCQDAICAPGYGNCNASSPDCESAYGAPGATCLPSFIGSEVYQDGDLVVAAGADGSTFVSGFVLGTTDVDPTGGVDLRTPEPATWGFFVTKLGADGSYAWSRVFTATGRASARGLAATADGGVIAIGDYSGDLDLDPGPGSDPLSSAFGAPAVLKLTGDGQVAWARTFPGDPDRPGGASAATVSVGLDGSIYVAGTFTGKVDFDPGPGVAERQTDVLDTIFAVKLTPAGDLGWVITYDLSLARSCTLAVNAVGGAADGSAWLAGTMLGTCDTDPGAGIDLRQSVSYSAGLFVRLNAAGNYVGAWLVPGRSGPVEAHAIAPSAGGSVYFAGYYIGDADFDPGPGTAVRTAFVNGAGSFVLELGADGAFRSVANLPSMVQPAIALASDGGIVVAGHDGPPFPVFRLIKIGVDHAPVWTLSMIGAAFQDRVDLAVGPGAILFTGNTASSVDLDPGAGEQVIDPDVWFVARYKL